MYKSFLSFSVVQYALQEKVHPCNNTLSSEITKKIFLRYLHIPKMIVQLITDQSSSRLPQPHSNLEHFWQYPVLCVFVLTRVQWVIIRHFKFLIFFCTQAYTMSCKMSSLSRRLSIAGHTPKFRAH